MQSFNHLITTRPHEVRQVLISDLHLSPEEPALVQAFLALLDDCLALPSLKRLFILGDWFEVWLGDDVYLSLSEDERTTHWLTPLIVKLKKLRIEGCEILVMHGNRDFLLGQPFCNLFGGALIYEPYTLTIGQQNYRLEHGDALCIDDKKYQFFRKIMRNRLTQCYLLNKSLEKRLAIADKMRKKSQQNNANKAAYIMDVNENAVMQAVTNSDALIHGHTHRPDIHKTIHDKIRYVLGDWRLLDSDKRQQKVSAVIGAVTVDENAGNNNAGFRLFEFNILV
ncbi:UDP-2,3-diacylglucosamine diphosphatase [Psychrobacter sp. ANT_WB68]|uniref:UDP-2,3-diacylglucosamine diphosphatase n=1 Tax=Psychrobacter sp. ANT_WB68 TaxID=2597355 RepID=UPI0011F227FC|nr:UDP-2,3-diacylglucosamine diphosphatase [Psychrobacter sp. ANT_WB68]KAA0915349.1 UDP-2,3-diacylglucosamine diphosphatase [Psychrobacter sp. ANT_WB68]